MPGVCSFFPDQLLKIYLDMNDPGLVELGGRVMTTAAVILPVYALACLIFQSLFITIVLYRNVLIGIEAIYLETKGGFYITQIKQLQDRIFERLLLENGIEISGGQGRILFILWKTDNLTISEISEKTSLAKNTVSVVINGMVNKGIVERNINPHNRRQMIVSLTEYAKSLQEKYETVSQQMNVLFYQGFSEEEQRQFERYLARILKTLIENLHIN